MMRRIRLLSKCYLKRQIFLGTALLCVFSLDVQASSVSPAPITLDCSKDLMRNFFPEALVNKTLRKFEISQDLWQPITTELSLRDKEVFKILAEKASKITPNPLTNPQERQAGLKLFLETLYEIFSTTLKIHGITDDDKIQAMFLDVRQQTAKSFGQCVKTEITKTSDVSSHEISAVE